MRHYKDYEDDETCLCMKGARLQIRKFNVRSDYYRPSKLKKNKQ